MVVGIAGIGGIGSNVARLLAQAKAGAIKIVDFDNVEISNLNRQFYKVSQEGWKKSRALEENLKQIHPDMEIEAIDMKIGPGDSLDLFSDCEIVVEGFDDKGLKKMLVEELSTTGKTLVSASGIAGRGMENIRMKKMGNCHIVGDFQSDHEEHELFPPKIAMITAIMAGIVLDSLKDFDHD